MNPDAPPMTPTQISTAELLHSVGRFPNSVLPVACLRELQSRDDLHPSIVAIIDQAIEAEDGPGGLGVQPAAMFEAFALWAVASRREDVGRLRRLLVMSQESIDTMVGDLDLVAFPYVVAGFFDGSDSKPILDELAEIDSRLTDRELNACCLADGVIAAVDAGHLDRSVAIDWMLERLLADQSRRHDFALTNLVIRLHDLEAYKVDGVDQAVREAFERQQLDEEVFRLKDWADTDRERRPPEPWSDVAEKLGDWVTPFTTESLSAIDFHPVANPNSSGRYGQRELTTKDIEEVIDDLRRSVDNAFPVDSFRTAQEQFPVFYQSLVSLIDEVVIGFEQEPGGEHGNGAYLAIALVIGQGMSLPGELVRRLYALPTDTRLAMLGDVLLIDRVASMTPMADYDFIQDFIWDEDREMADRREAVPFFTQAVYRNQISRDDAIQVLLAGLDRAEAEEPLLISSYVTALAFLSPAEHRERLLTAIKAGGEELLSRELAIRMMNDPKFAAEQYHSMFVQHGTAQGILALGVLYEGDPLDPSPPVERREPSIPSPPKVQRDLVPVSTVVNPTQKISRNDACPCGSGKKYKKCCMN